MDQELLFINVILSKPYPTREKCLVYQKNLSQEGFSLLQGRFLQQFALKIFSDNKNISFLRKKNIRVLAKNAILNLQKFLPLYF